MKTRLEYKLEARAIKLNRIYRKFEIAESDLDFNRIPLIGLAINELNNALPLIDETLQLITENIVKDPFKAQRKNLLQESKSKIQECLTSFKTLLETDANYKLQENDQKTVRQAIYKAIRALHQNAK